MVGVAHAVCVGFRAVGVAVGFLEYQYVALGGIVGEGEDDVVLHEAEALLAA